MDLFLGQGWTYQLAFDTKPGASYLVCPSDPDVCIPVRDGYALTVLVRWEAWGIEPRCAAA